MNVDFINNLLFEQHKHLVGKKNFLEYFSNLEYTPVNEHMGVLLSEKVKTPFGEFSTGISLVTLTHTDEQIEEFLSTGVVRRQPIIRFIIKREGYEYNTKQSMIMCIRKIVPYEVLPELTQNYLSGLYHLRSGDTIGGAMKVTTDTHQYSHFMEDYSALFSTIFDGYDVRMSQKFRRNLIIPPIMTPSGRIETQHVHTSQNTGNSQLNIRDIEVQQVLFEPEELFQKYTPATDDAIFNLNILGIPEHQVKESISNVTLLGDSKYFAKEIHSPITPKFFASCY